VSSASAARQCAPAASSCGRRAPSFIPARTSASGRDFTIFALVDGTVEYQTFKQRGTERRRVSIKPVVATAAAVSA
jgi:ribosomal protein L27